MRLEIYRADCSRPVSEDPTAPDKSSARALAADDAPHGEQAEDLERAVDYIVDECFFTLGQVVGTRKTLDYHAVVWWRDHYRARFLSAMQAFGNRWMADRDNVTGVAFLLAERATRYAGDAASIDVATARRAAADVERYCQLHSSRSARAVAAAGDCVERPLLAGYWCTQEPKAIDIED